MKVFNLTDVPTEVLERLGLVRANLRVGDVSVPPGESVVVPERYRAELAQMVGCGALAIGAPPPSYRPAPVEPVAHPTLPSIPMEPPPPDTESAGESDDDDGDAPTDAEEFQGDPEPGGKRKARKKRRA